MNFCSAVHHKKLIFFLSGLTEKSIRAAQYHKHTEEPVAYGESRDIPDEQVCVIPFIQLNLFTPKSDQRKISPDSINTFSSKGVIRREQISTKGYCSI